MPTKNSTDKSRDNFSDELKKFAEKDVKVIRKFLMDVIKGKRKDSQFDPKTCKVIQKPIPMATRVDATKAYEKFVMGRVVASKKDTQEVNVHHNLVDGAVEAIAQRKQAEKAKKEDDARKSGKLAEKVIGG